ncbi:MAG TPA: hypothetical protein VE377_20555 [Candidatus Dormibacteraeota bacterium]|nr:hypothetical protein [Candidatus Dormibacteraeota bacterium]
MFKKILIAGAVIATLVLGGPVQQATSQDSAPAKHPSEAAEPGHSYRLDFTVHEIEDGKKINSRQYSMNLNAGDQSEIKIGTRVPVEVKQSEIQYLDVGMNIWCRLRDRNDVNWLANDVMLNVRSDLSNFAIPDQQGQSMRPAIRQMKIDSSAIVTVGKSLVIGVVDDPNSKRQFQLEVVATKLR